MKTKEQIQSRIDLLQDKLDTLEEDRRLYNDQAFHSWSNYFNTEIEHLKWVLNA